MMSDMLPASYPLELLHLFEHLVNGILATRMILEEFQDVVISEDISERLKAARYSAVVRCWQRGDRASH